VSSRLNHSIELSQLAEPLAVEEEEGASCCTVDTVETWSCSYDLDLVHYDLFPDTRKLRSLTKCRDHLSDSHCICCHWDRRSHCFRRRPDCYCPQHCHPKPTDYAGRKRSRDSQLAGSAIRVAAVDVIILRLAVTDRQKQGGMQDVLYSVILPKDRVQNLN
jgi:hypothetical protein